MMAIHISSKMFPKWIRLILKYFSFWGFYFASSSMHGKFLNVLIFLVHVISCVWCSTQLFQYSAYQRSFLEFMDLLNSLLYVSSGILLYWLIVYDSFRNQKNLRNFWNVFIRINDQIHAQRKFGKWEYLRIFFLYNIGSVFFGILMLFTDYTSSVSNIILHCIIMHIVDHRVLFYLLHLSVIAYQLQMIEIELKKCRIQWKIRNKRLKWIRNYFKLVHEMSDLTNKIFGWSHLVLIILSFYSMVVFLNVGYSLVHGKIKKYDSGQ